VRAKVSGRVRSGHAGAKARAEKLSSDERTAIAKKAAAGSMLFLRMTTRRMIFCQRVYKETGGATQELRRAYDFYLKNYNAGSQSLTGFGRNSNRSV